MSNFMMPGRHILSPSAWMPCSFTYRRSLQPFFIAALLILVPSMARAQVVDMSCSFSLSGRFGDGQPYSCSGTGNIRYTCEEGVPKIASFGAQCTGSGGRHGAYTFNATFTHTGGGGSFSCRVPNCQAAGFRVTAMSFSQSGVSALLNGRAISPGRHGNPPRHPPGTFDGQCNASATVECPQPTPTPTPSPTPTPPPNPNPVNRVVP